MKTFWRAFRAEFLSVARNPGALLVVMGAILLYALFYPVPYSPQVLKQVPIIVADLDGSELSRTLVRMADASELLRIQGRATSLADAEQQMRQQEAGGILLIPSGFEQTVLRGEQAFVAAYADASYLLIYRQVLTGLLSASGTLSAGVEVKRMVARGIPAETAMASRAPIQFAGRPLFNAVEGYSTFVVPSVLLLILQQTILIGTGLVEGSRRETGSVTRTFPLMAAPLVVLGRSLFYLLVYWVNAWFYLGPLSRWYGFPSEGNSLVMIFFTQPFLLSAIFLGLAGAAFFRNRQRSMQVFAVTSLPMLLVAGVVWPTELIPGWIRGLSYAVPSTPAIAGFLRINMMGANLDEVSPEYLHLWLLTLAYFPLACIAQWLANRQTQLDQELGSKSGQPETEMAPTEGKDGAESP